MVHCFLFQLKNRFHFTSHPSIFIGSLFLVSTVLFAGFSGTVQAQTTGVIFKSAGTGSAVLDPNRDGYTSLTTAGYQGSDVGSASEIQYKPLPQLIVEPNSDLMPGPDSKFTDMVDNGNQHTVGMYVDGNNNFLFRFRLSGAAPNSKGYSILLDLDNKFWTAGPNADLNAVPGNPGFELEILLATNFGVYVRNIDGNTNSTLSNPLSYDTYCQKSIAYTTDNGDIDVFYDFYVPLSSIQSAYSGFSLTTPIRATAVTCIAPHSGMFTNTVSDVLGLRTGDYGNNLSAAYYAAILNFQPTTAQTIQNGGSFAADRTLPPVVDGPIMAGATRISGTCIEAAGTIISIYSDGALIGTTTVLSNHTWTFTTAALSLGVHISATATASGELVSEISNIQLVGGRSCAGATSNTVSSIVCSSKKGIEGTVPTSTPANSIVRLYEISSTGVRTLALQTLTTANYDFFLKCNSQNTSCRSGSPQGVDCLNTTGSYLLTLEEPGKCESGFSPVSTCFANGINSTTPTPTITTLNSTQQTTIVSGLLTTTSTYRIYLFADGNIIGTTLISSNGALPPSSTWSISNLTLKAGMVLQAVAIEGTKCISAPSASQTVTGTVVPPSINGPLLTTSTIITGSAMVEPGTVITVYRNGTSIGTAVVDNNYNWSLANVTLQAYDNITAAIILPSGARYTSAAVQVLPPTNASVTVTGPLYEGGNTVSGTTTASNGTTINVYADGYLIGTTTATNGAWSLTGLSTNPQAPALYATAKIIATAQAANSAESAGSTPVIVQCPVLTVNNAVSALQNAIRRGSLVTIIIDNTVSGLLYTLRNSANNINLSSSKLSAGGTLQLVTTSGLQTSQTILVEVQKISGEICTAILSNSVYITVYPDADIAVGNTSTANNYL